MVIDKKDENIFIIDINIFFIGAIQPIHTGVYNARLFAIIFARVICIVNHRSPACNTK